MCTYDEQLVVILQVAMLVCVASDAAVRRSATFERLDERLTLHFDVALVVRSMSRDFPASAVAPRKGERAGDRPESDRSNARSVPHQPSDHASMIVQRSLQHARLKKVW